MSIIQKVSRRVARQEAAEAIAHWLRTFRYPDGKTGLAVEDFVELVKRPDPFFEAVLEGLRRRPDWDPTVIRNNKTVIAEMGEERWLRQSDGTEVLVDEGKHDYWQILREDVLHEHHHQHVLAIADEDVWPDFVRQMDATRDILLRV